MSQGVGGRQSLPGEAQPQGVPGPMESAERELGRRELLRVLGTTGALLTASAVLPRHWSSPLIDVGALPAHAQTSAAAACGPNPTLTVSRDPMDQSVSLSWSGLSESVTIWRAPAGDPPVYAELAQVDLPVSSYKDTKADPGLAYYYQVRGECTLTSKVVAQGVVP